MAWNSSQAFLNLGSQIDVDEQQSAELSASETVSEKESMFLRAGFVL